jgi:hypothetical protein
MRRILILFICIAVIASTLITVSAQDRRRRSRFGRKARTAAIIGAGTAAGALIGGKKGAAIGAGGSTLYAVNRGAARRNFKRRNRKIGTVAGGTLLGAGVGGAIGRGKGAAIGAAAGAGSSYIYTRKSRRFRRPY